MGGGWEEGPRGRPATGLKKKIANPGHRRGVGCTPRSGAVVCAWPGREVGPRGREAPWVPDGQGREEKGGRGWVCVCGVREKWVKIG